MRKHGHKRKEKRSMYFTRKKYESLPEFLKSADYQTVSCTVSDTGVEADAQGHKFVLAGSFLDVDGQVISAAEGTPVGILFDTVEVTYGPQPGALLIDGSVNTERLVDTGAVEAVQTLISKLPYIKFFVEGQLQIAGEKEGSSSGKDTETNLDVTSTEKK